MHITNHTGQTEHLPVLPDALSTGPDRRTFLGDAMRTPFTLSLASVLAGGHARAADANAHAPQEETQHAEHPHDLPPALDWLTAGAVAADFFRHVIYRGAVKGKSLGPASAAELNALAWARVGALHWLGGEEGKHLSQHERDEIINGLVPMPLLVALSDFTTTELKADPSRIFQETQRTCTDAQQYRSIARPDLSAGVQQWEAHAERANTDLRQVVGKAAGVTSVLAPLGTTYASSSLADAMKDDVMHILYEQSFALEVLRLKRQSADAVILHHDVHQAALRRSDQLMNGYWGYSKLQLTTAANSMGGFGIGDPPEIYFAIKHAASPQTLAMAQGFGMANSEVYTVVLNGMWMMRAGVLQPCALQEFVRYQLQAARAVWQTLAHADMRSVSLGGGGAYMQAVLDALSTLPDDQGSRVREVLLRIPAAKFQASLSGYAAGKVEALQAAMGRVPVIAQELVCNSEEFAGSAVFGRLTQAFAAKDVRGMHAMLKDIEHMLQTQKAQRLASLFDDMLSLARTEAAEAVSVPANTAATLPEANPVTQDIPVTEDARSQRVRETMQCAAAIGRELAGMGAVDRDGRLARAHHELGLGAAADPARIRAALSTADASTVQRAIRALTRLPGSEDVIPGLGAEDDAHTQRPALLSHSAKEVLYALLTQIPSVPALSRMAKLSIPAVAGVRNGQRPTVAQLKRIVALLLPIEAGMSGLADNVAAYLFSEEVLQHFFQQTYGADVLERKPMLKAGIGIVCLKLAEMAGSLTKVGNGPNFSQCKISLVDDACAQGVAINRTELPMAETLRNGFAQTLNGSFVLMAIAYLHQQIDALHAESASAQG